MDKSTTKNPIFIQVIKISTYKPGFHVWTKTSQWYCKIHTFVVFQQRSGWNYICQWVTEEISSNVWALCLDVWCKLRVQNLGVCWYTGLNYVKYIHPLWNIYHKHYTGGVLISNGLAYWTLPHKISTPSVIDWINI